MSISAHRRIVLASFALPLASISMAAALFAGCATNVDDTVDDPTPDGGSVTTEAAAGQLDSSTGHVDSGKHDASATPDARAADTGADATRPDGATLDATAPDASTPDATTTPDASTPDATTTPDTGADASADASTPVDASDSGPVVNLDGCTVTPLACDGQIHACNGVVNYGCPGGVALGSPLTASPILGNPNGGTAYNDACPDGQVLVGLQGRIGGSLDSIGAICGIPTIKEDPSTNPYSYSVTIAAGATLAVRGGTSTSQWARNCPVDTAVVAFSGRAGNLIDGVQIECAPLVVSGAIGTFSVAPGAATPLPYLGGTGGSPFARYACPTPQVARLANIRAGNSVDAFGFTCATVAVALR